MRRAWFNVSLGHWDAAMPDLKALQPDRLGDRHWRYNMLCALRGKREWTHLAALALDLHERGVVHESAPDDALQNLIEPVVGRDLLGSERRRRPEGR